MKKPGAEERIAELKRALDDPSSAAAATLLRAGLADASAAVVTQAAQIISERELGDLGPDVQRALERLLDAGGDADKGCLAKIALADTLYKLGNAQHDVLLRGLRWVQMEPVWGKHIDVAGNLRGLCALALVSINYPAVLFEVGPLLFDPEKEARLHAVTAVGASEQTAGELMLRVKAMAPDPDAEVTGECLASLMKMSPQRSLQFVAGFLQHTHPVIRDGAALAIGESHLPEAFIQLRNCWDENVLADVRTGLLLPIALLRTDEAFDFLLRVVAESELKLAQGAVSACRIYANDEARMSQLRGAVNKRRLAKLTATYHEMLRR